MTDAQAYFNDVCCPVGSVAGRAQLRSAENGDLTVLRTRTVCFGNRSFRMAAPMVWNRLPPNNNNNNNNTFVERHSAVASEALAEQVS